MTVQEFYDEVGGDYNEIMSRLRTEDRIRKFAGMFTRDESYLFQSSHEITEVLRGKDIEGAKKMLEKVTEDYDIVITGIGKLLA